MGKKIDYRIRTAKYIERGMLIDVFRKLEVFQPLDKYKYIGFGSIYFTDFILFHKYLNIRNMVSIEINDNEKERYLLNQPYKFIKLQFGRCSEVIDKVLDSDNNIIWLDYDSYFNITETLDCINKVIDCAKSGTFLNFTFNIEQIFNEVDINKFNEELSPYLSFNFKKVDFQKATFPKTIRKIINSYIEKRLNIINQQNVENKLLYKQLIFIKYQDSIRMLSIGGVFVEENDSDKYDRAHFKDDLEFISCEDNIYNIDIPILTPKEIQIIDNPMIDINTRLKNQLDSEFEKYKKIYKYYPHYVDSNIM